MNLIQYNNELHKLNFSILTETQMNILFAIFQQISADNKDTKYEVKENYVYMPLNEFLDLAEISTTNKDFKNAVLDKLDILQSFKYRHYTTGTATQEIIFPLLHIDTKQNYIAVEVSRNFVEQYIINEFGGYTKYDYKELAYLNGTYTKTIYRYLKQFRNKGEWWIKYDDFKKLLNIPSNYQACNIDQRIIKPALKALSQPLNLFEITRIPFENLKCKKIKNGKKIEKLLFTFKKQGKEAEQEQEQNTIIEQEPQAQITATQKPQQQPRAEPRAKIGGNPVLCEMLKNLYIGKGFWSGVGNEKAFCKITNITITPNPKNPYENYTIHATNQDTQKDFELKVRGQDDIKQKLNPYWD